MPSKKKLLQELIHKVDEDQLRQEINDNQNCISNKKFFKFVQNSEGKINLVNKTVDEKYHNGRTLEDLARKKYHDVPHINAILTSTSI
jgi:hypothetical protein